MTQTQLCAFLYSPLSLGLVWEHGASILVNDMRQTLKMFQTYREEMNALPMAQHCWEAGVQSGRIVSHERFDLYLPNQSKFSKKNQYQQKQGLIFLPGLMVNHRAYANCAKRLSDEGIIVVVVSAEPLRMPAKLLGCDASDIRRIQNSVEALLLQNNNQHRACMQLQVEWSLGGHSFGAYRAMALANALNVRKLVIWAAGSFEEYIPKQLSSAHIRVLAIHADRDRICSFSSEEEYARFKLKMPSGAIHFMVNGGNHAGFASYPKNAFEIESRISRRVQHERICGRTAKFLVNSQ